MEKIKKEQKRALIYYIRYNEDENKNEVIVINKWYWLGTKNLRQMAPYIVSFIEEILNSKEIKPCIYLSDLSKEEIEKRLDIEGLKEDKTLSMIRID